MAIKVEEKEKLRREVKKVRKKVDFHFFYKSIKGILVI